MADHATDWRIGYKQRDNQTKSRLASYSTAGLKAGAGQFGCRTITKRAGQYVVRNEGGDTLCSPSSYAECVHAYPLMEIVHEETIMTQKLKLLRDGDYDQLFFQENPVNDCGQFDDPDSDPPAYALIRLEYIEEHGDEAVREIGRFLASVVIVGPKWVGDKEIESALNSYGEDREWFDELSIEWQCEVLLEYGTAATVWQLGGNNKAELLRKAKQELIGVNITFGFYLDRTCNAIGSTGWDFLRGDITAGLQRART